MSIAIFILSELSLLAFGVAPLLGGFAEPSTLDEKEKKIRKKRVKGRGMEEEEASFYEYKTINYVP
jgi:hypothetical protein